MNSERQGAIEFDVPGSPRWSLVENNGMELFVAGAVLGPSTTGKGLRPN